MDKALHDVLDILPPSVVAFKSIAAYRSGLEINVNVNIAEVEYVEPAWVCLTSLSIISAVSLIQRHRHEESLISPLLSRHHVVSTLLPLPFVPFPAKSLSNPWLSRFRASFFALWSQSCGQDSLSPPSHSTFLLPFCHSAALGAMSMQPGPYRLENKKIVDFVFVTALSIAAMHKIPFQVHAGYVRADHAKCLCLLCR